MGALAAGGKGRFAWRQVQGVRPKDLLFINPRSRASGNTVPDTRSYTFQWRSKRTLIQGRKVYDRVSGTVFRHRIST